MNSEVRLLKIEELFDKDFILIDKEVGKKCVPTDFAILLGSYVSNSSFLGNENLKNRTTYWGLLDSESGCPNSIDADGDLSIDSASVREDSLRPVLNYSLVHQVQKKTVNEYGISEIEYGEYPQTIVDNKLMERLETELDDGSLEETGNVFTVDTEKSKPFTPESLKEYIYEGKKYVRVKARPYMYASTLSNGKDIRGDHYYWVEVKPITWYIDEKKRLLLSKYGLVGGIRYCDDFQYDGNFRNTEIYTFLNKYFIKEIIASSMKKLTEEELMEIEKRHNPYNLVFKGVSEEDIIKGAIDSGIAVFLHGPSSEGKSARIKQIDKDCVIIYLGSSTPESINGKSVYDDMKNEMIDVKPSWLGKLEAICKKEPDKNHVVFFDELTNALPSIQSMAFNIVLDREVNGKWKLPDNARIVASGNDMKDSIAANKLAEPLFNRFAHVYIKTTTKNWLEWASKNNIHPAIYAYIAYKNGEVLRTEYDGEKPNADPRKWEMASKVLYSTMRPSMIKALVGEDITKEFMEFCNQSVITLEDVLNDNYTDEDLDYLNTAERYATVMALSSVDEDHLDKVREFISKFSPEYLSLFDGIWTRGDKDKIEIINKVNMEIKGGMKK